MSFTYINKIDLFQLKIDSMKSLDFDKSNEALIDTLTIDIL